jgi:hypothetical protein
MVISCYLIRIFSALTPGGPGLSRPARATGLAYDPLGIWRAILLRFWRAAPNRIENKDFHGTSGI